MACFTNVPREPIRWYMKRSPGSSLVNLAYNVIWHNPKWGLLSFQRAIGHGQSFNMGLEGRCMDLCGNPPPFHWKKSRIRFQNSLNRRGMGELFRPSRYCQPVTLISPSKPSSVVRDDVSYSSSRSKKVTSWLPLYQQPQIPPSSIPPVLCMPSRRSL